MVSSETPRIAGAIRRPALRVLLLDPARAGRGRARTPRSRPSRAPGPCRPARTRSPCGRGAWRRRRRRRSASGPRPSPKSRAREVKSQYSSSDSPLKAKTGMPFGFSGVPSGPTATAAAAWSWVEKMLHDTQRTSAPSARSVSISTAVWMVMWSEPMMRWPASGCAARVLGAHRHQARHLLLGEADLVPPPLGEGEIEDVEVELLVRWRLRWSSALSFLNGFGRRRGRFGRSVVRGRADAAPGRSPRQERRALGVGLGRQRRAGDVGEAGGRRAGRRAPRSRSRCGAGPCGGGSRRGRGAAGRRPRRGRRGAGCAPSRRAPRRRPDVGQREKQQRPRRSSPSSIGSASSSPWRSSTFFAPRAALAAPPPASRASGRRRPRAPPGARASAPPRRCRRRGRRPSSRGGSRACSAASVKRSP